MCERSSAITFIVDGFISSRCKEAVSGMSLVFFFNFCLWSDASAKSGEMKRVMPLLMYVATWYTRDLPPPVGLTSIMFVFFWDRCEVTIFWITVDCHSWGVN